MTSQGRNRVMNFIGQELHFTVINVILQSNSQLKMKWCVQSSVFPGLVSDQLTRKLEELPSYFRICKRQSAYSGRYPLVPLTIAPPTRYS
jgi:hypothetical protein